MTDKSIHDLPGPLATPASDDEVGVWDLSAGQYVRCQLSTLIGAVILNGGTLDLAGKSIVAPASGTLALIDVAQTYTALMTSAPSTNSNHGFTVNMPIGATTTARAYRAMLDNTLRYHVQVDTANNEIVLAAFDNGANDGCNLQLNRNNNATTPASGYVAMVNRGGTNYRVWPDATGVLRINNADPTSANDTAGTVVGAQTSHAEYKRIVDYPVTDATALAMLLTAAYDVRRFTYADGRYNGEEFSGLVLDGPDLHRYGMDADADHPAGKALNVINVIGDLLLAIRHLTERISVLEAHNAR